MKFKLMVTVKGPSERLVEVPLKFGGANYLEQPNHCMAWMWVASKIDDILAVVQFDLIKIELLEVKE